MINLPLAFITNFKDVIAIIDCFEIEIAQPSQSSLQALPFSNYKSCNTCKILISVTPNGHIQYISKAYPGHYNDMRIVLESGILSTFIHYTSVMADRGFKSLAEILQNVNVKLLRPLSKLPGEIMSNENVIKTKRIASLRIHLERSIGRIRTFSILKPHSVLPSSAFTNIDDFLIIAASLSNIQTNLIKI